VRGHNGTQQAHGGLPSQPAGGIPATRHLLHHRRLGVEHPLGHEHGVDCS